ncbi:MAG: hypothetical protein ACOC58_00225 [Chloroflexota bacterium]
MLIWLREWLCKPLIYEIEDLQEELESLRWLPPSENVPGAAIIRDWRGLQRRIAQGLGLGWQDVEMLDTHYSLPALVVWQHLDHWGAAHVTPRYRAPNQGIDCVDLARAMVHFVKWALYEMCDLYTIGQVLVRLPSGTRHMLNLVVSRDTEELLFLDRCPRHLFAEPPTEGPFRLPQGWQPLRAEI